PIGMCTSRRSRLASSLRNLARSGVITGPGHNAMTRETAAIYARRGVRANALCPGPVMTPLLAKFLSDDAKRERRLVHIPMGRFGESHEIVNGALFLASNESSWMTGQSLVIDGGITSAYVTPEGPAWS
ncbi:MAG: SDR family oxidoreductase, partial [Actinomycetota bacterium]